MKQRSSSTDIQTSLPRRSTRPSGKSAAVRSGKGVKVEKSITINRTPEELFAFWRNFENLPRVMEHIESIQCLDDKRSHWRARRSDENFIEWDAEVINERENELIAWESLKGSDVRQAGTVRFTAAPGGLGTEVKLAVEYEVPGGFFTNALAKLLKRSPEQQIQEDLRHFKQLMETGEIPTTAGQSAGRDEDKTEKYEEAK
jgi:uncharacterized membrane protein